MTAIVDCNSFYCSCERLFRPDLRDKPVVVLSNNDGCIISRSDEARALGVGMAVPYFEARPLIEKHGIAVFSSNYPLYGDMSYRVMETLRIIAGDMPKVCPPDEPTPSASGKVCPSDKPTPSASGKVCPSDKQNPSASGKVEVYSVDEAFMDIEDMSEEALTDQARQIKTTVEQWTGISVSIGVAPTKTLAKLANRLAKKDKLASGCLTVLATEEQRNAALRQTRVDALWGIGRAYAAKLINWGITSAWDLSNMREEWAHTNLGGVVGVRLIRELRGIPSISREEELVDKKMIATTRMFGRPVTSITEIKEAVATYISRAAEKLRRQQSAARTVSVFIVPKEHSQEAHVPRGVNVLRGVNVPHGAPISAYTTLANPTSLTQQLIKAAVGLVDQLFESGRAYKKAGVMLGGLVPDDSIQGNLFVPQTANQHRFLMNTIDNINFAMRDDSVKFGSSGMNKNWKMRQELRSQRHSTRWSELKSVC